MLIVNSGQLEGTEGRRRGERWGLTQSVHTTDLKGKVNVSLHVLYSLRRLTGQLMAASRREEAQLWARSQDIRGPVGWFRGIGGGAVQCP